jgi:hypothetical protein
MLVDVDDVCLYANVNFDVTLRSFVSLVLNFYDHIIQSQSKKRNEVR